MLLLPLLPQACNLDYDRTTVEPGRSLRCEPMLLGRGSVDAHMRAFIQRCADAAQAEGEAIRVPGAGRGSPSPRPPVCCTHPLCLQ